MRARKMKEEPPWNTSKLQSVSHSSIDDSTMAEPPSSSSDDEENALENSIEGIVGRARMAEIQESRKKITELQERVQLLQEQHERQVQKASLLCDANSAYRSLSRREKNKKKNVLLALKSDVVPDCMRWGKGGFHSSFPSRLYLDRDVFLARLELDSFEDNYKDETFRVPTRFRDDKEVMMAVCAKNSQALALASKELCNDRDVVLAAVQQRFHLAPLALQHASTKLRGDRKIVSAALNREHGIRCFKFLAPKLQNDHRLAMSAIVCSSEECSRVYEHLSELPEELREDYDVSKTLLSLPQLVREYDVYRTTTFHYNIIYHSLQIVMAAVKKRGSNLRFVTDPDLLEDKEIVEAACQQDGNALQFVPEGSELRTAMLKRENLKTILANGGGAMLQFASPRNQINDELILLAVENGLSDIPNLAMMYQDNLSLLKRVLNLSSKLYLNLPCDLKAKRELGLEALFSESLDETTANEIVTCVPALLEEREPMLFVAKKGYFAILARCPVEIRDNKATMAAACSVKSDFWKIASARLRMDPDVVRAALTSSTLDPCCVFELSTEFFVQNAGMAELAINVYDGNDYRRLYNRLPPAVLETRSVFLAWIRKGWKIQHHFPTLSEVERRGYQHDDEVLLALIDFDRYFFQKACKCKRSNRAFMKKAIEVDGRVIVYAEEDLRQDFDMMLLAIGSSCKTLQTFCHREGKDSRDLIDFAQKTRERLDVAETFIRHFLRGISIETTPRRAPRKRCHLPRLDCGYETGAHFKREIAEFAGVPMGPQLTLLRSASANLEFWGY
jgi:hypothetical protein